MTDKRIAELESALRKIIAEFDSVGGLNGFEAGIVDIAQAALSNTTNVECQIVPCRQGDVQEVPSGPYCVAHQSYNCLGLQRLLRGFAPCP